MRPTAIHFRTPINDGQDDPVPGWLIDVQPHTERGTQVATYVVVDGHGRTFLLDSNYQFSVDTAELIRAELR